MPKPLSGSRTTGAASRRARHSRAQDVDREISQLQNKSLEQLRQAWRERFGIEPLMVKSREFTLRLLAWRIQVEAFGDHDPRIKRKLTLLAAAFEQNPRFALSPQPNLKAGTVLTREWKGVVHRVLVQASGFIYDERHYRSLSDVARAITGTHWSGPRFFGLEQRARAALKESTSGRT